MMSQVELVELAKMRNKTLTCTTPRGPAPGAHEYKYEISLSILPLDPTYTKPPHPPTEPTPVAQACGDCDRVRDGQVGRDVRVSLGAQRGERVVGDAA